MEEDNLTVVAAAIRKEDGRVFSSPAPDRHHDVIKLMGAEFDQRDEQGFILSDGSWVRRKPALYIAIRSGQIKEGKWPAHGLFSEDLW